MTIKKTKDTQYAPHPEGQTVVVCVDVIDMGEKLDTWQGKVKVGPKVVLVFMSAEVNEGTGEHYLLQREFSVSVFAKASLRIFLESWRGKKYQDEMLETEGLPLHKLVGVAGLANVEHRESGAGRTYANIQSLVPVPKGLAIPTLPEYTRPEFFAERKAEYAAAVTAHRAANAPAPTAKGGGPGKEKDVPDFDDFPAALEDDDDESALPF